MVIIHLISEKNNSRRLKQVIKRVHELATRQVNAGEKIQVWHITSDSGDNYPVGNYPTAVFHASRNSLFPGQQLKTAIGNRKNKAIFHLHGGFIPALYSTAMFLKEQDIPFVYSPHGSYEPASMQKNRIIKKLYFSILEKKLLRAARSIHSLSRSEINGLQSVFPNKKSVWIPYGLEPVPLPQKKYAGNQFIIGFYGRLENNHKAPEEVLSGFCYFHRQHANSQLWIIGDGPQKLRLIKLAEAAGIANAVVFFGSRHGEEKSSLFQQCHVFAALGQNEDPPGVLLKAASFGIPCLVTEDIHTVNVVRKYNAGIVIREANAAEICRALTELHDYTFSGRQVTVFWRNAHRMISAEFAWEQIIPRFSQMYTGQEAMDKACPAGEAVA